MLDNAGQVDCRFNSGVSAADNGNILTFKERAVTVRAVCHTFVLELSFTRDVDIAPAGTC
ncbi:Uncharacterised protein [Mycobacteroides abscessus subsp. abscessus]|nr:Uncharacterised protein [Mycobacteroides abscessus subsp. abscessus]